MKHELIVEAINALNDTIDALDTNVSRFENYIDVVRDGDIPRNTEKGEPENETGGSKAYSLAEFLDSSGPMW